MAPRISARKRDSIVKALKAGGQLAGIARKHQVSPSAVKSIRIQEGLNPLPTPEAKELAARARDTMLLDARRRRAELQVRLLEDAERLRGQLFAPAKVFNFGGKDNTFETADLPEPVFKDKQSLMIAIGIAIDKSLVLEKYDQESVTAAKAAIIDLVDRLGEGLEELEPQAAAS